MPKVICLDSNVVVWGIKHEASPGQEAKIGRAQELLRVLSEEKAIAIIPAPVISEILLRIPKEKHAAVVNLLSARFRVVSFDTPAAVIAAQIRQQLMDSGEFKKIQEGGEKREAIKFDIQIVAVAKLHRVKCLYTEDDGLIRAAKAAGVHIAKLPMLGKQVPMFPDEELQMPKGTLKIKGTMDQVLTVAVTPKKSAPKKKGAAKKKAAPKKRPKRVR